MAKISTAMNIGSKTLAGIEEREIEVKGARSFCIFAESYYFCNLQKPSMMSVIGSCRVASLCNRREDDWEIEYLD